MTCRRAVVKLGGSVITVKSSPETIDYENLEKALRQLAEYYRMGGRLVIVHGGGSFGHVTVARILEERGRLTALDSSIIQRSMLKLAVNIIAKLQEYGLNPSLHPPHTLCKTVDRKTCDLEPVKRDVVEGLTPVTYGDAIPENGKTRIISGDDLAAEIAVRLNADCLVYVIREGGVLDSKGHIISRLSTLSQLEILNITWADVTGGIRKKMEAAIEASKIVENVIVTDTENLLKALRGEHVGTRIKAEENKPS